MMNKKEQFSLVTIVSFCFVVAPAIGATHPFHSPSQQQKQQNSVSTKTLMPSPIETPPKESSTPIEIASPRLEQPKEEPFRFQLGAGLTLIPARGIQYIIPAYIDYHYYQGGIQGNLMLRVHPRLTVGVALGYLATNVYDINGDLLQELNLTATLRVHLRSLSSAKPNRLFIMPYLSVGPQFGMMFPQVNIMVSSGERSYHLFSLGGHLGAGAEFRLKQLSPHLALHAEAQFLVEGFVNRGEYRGSNYTRARIGGQLNLGAIWYF